MWLPNFCGGEEYEDRGESGDDPDGVDVEDSRVPEAVARLDGAQAFSAIDPPALDDLPALEVCHRFVGPVQKTNEHLEHDRRSKNIPLDRQSAIFCC